MAKRQTELKGTERPVIKELDDICGAYAEALYNRMELQGNEKDYRAQVIERMKQLRQKAYTYVDGEFEFSFTLEQNAKLKTKRKRVGEDDDVAVEEDPEE